SAGSESGRRANVSPAVQAVEGLEARQMLSAAVGRKFMPGKIFRPPTDAIPSYTLRPHKVSDAVRKTGLAHTQYLQMLPKGVNTPTAVGSEVPLGLNAAQVRQAYGMNNVAFDGIVGDGAGQTIAIVAAYDHPGFVNSTDPNYENSDLHKFSVAMGLPDPPSFTKIDQNGGTNYPASDPGWAAEIALDVEWAHAMAPMANIVLVEANSAYNADLLGKAANTARKIPGVTVVSMSFGIDGGTAGETYYDQFFTTPAGHDGVTFVAATGDRGAVLPMNGNAGGTATGAYPAESVNVVAVGGTTLNRKLDGSYAGESAWIGSGGGISNYEAKPIYQAGVTQSSTKRTIPDVAMLADPNTGVAVYDSYNNTSGGGWSSTYFGGTSLAAPLWAGVIAVVNQGRALDDRPALNGVTQTLPRLYQLPGSTLNDVTTGHNRRDGVNGYDAGPGYDLVTGRGTPIGGQIAPALAGGLYTGQTFADGNGNGRFDGTEAVLSGVTVYNDVNNNARFDNGETRATSDASGAYALDLVGGITYRLRASADDASATTAAYTGTTAYGTFGGFSLGLFPTAYNAPAGTNTYTLRLAPGGTTLQVFLNTDTNGTPIAQMAKSSVSNLVFNGNTGDDTLILDMTNGDPRPADGIAFNGGGQSSADRIRVIANAAGTNVQFGGGTTALVNNAVLGYTGVEAFSFAGGTGRDTLTVTSGLSASPGFTGGGGADRLELQDAAYALSADLATDGSAVTLAASGTSRVTLNTTQHLAGLTITGDATVSMPGGGRVLRTGALVMDSTASLDLAGNAMIVDYVAASASPLSTVVNRLTGGYAGATWTGTGIRSSSAAADTVRRHALGAGEASAVLGLSGGATQTFLGEVVDATTVLVRYTLYGDSNLDGRTNFNDFLIFQVNFNKPGSSFAKGDYDYNGYVDFNDFLRLQVSFNRVA
ncbi:MAG TPA: S53 family peptidase, partial [Tepidisphaeraceae bacterium]